ncbi:hypothetical protein [Nocardioides flavescens]|uniref:Uncharacterized protein n=1 Tax=Nocardioides flavescens TaxID=2691959 RepID=A0A6L7ER62_9ACTN|nr:hypothetical protein [Nocardioides flavescens]MXG89160.1 hypothetical protein [Nocardioides flavescens]
MTTIHDQLADSVGDVHTDLSALAVAARAKGLARRRQRRALGAVGAVTAALVVGTAVHALAPAPLMPSTVVATDSGAHEAHAGADTSLVALDGRATAGLLADAVAAQGLAASASRGQGDAAGSGETYAEIGIDGVPGARIEVNVQHVPVSSAPAELVAGRRDDDKIGTDTWVAIRTDHQGGLRVTVQLVVPEGQSRPLTVEQLKELAADASWAFDVPATASGEAPEPYTSLGR